MLFVQKDLKDRRERAEEMSSGVHARPARASAWPGHRGTPGEGGTWWLVPVSEHHGVRSAGAPWATGSAGLQLVYFL